MKLTIERLGHGGDGVAKTPDGETVFVPQTLPGEEVEGELDGNRLTGVRIITPSENRVRPPCPHFKTCGGCSMQHVRDEVVADWKQDIVRVALAARGIDAPIRGIKTSPAGSRRRAAFSGRRPRSGPVVGLHARGSDLMVEIPECRLMSPGLMAGMDGMRALSRALASRKTELTIHVTETDTGLDIRVDGAPPQDVPRMAGLATVAEEHDMARLSMGDELVAERRPPMVRLGPANVVLPAGAFLQATKAGEGDLLASVLEAVGDARRVADLFAGCGTFALPLSERAEVHAVEGLDSLTTALTAGWRGVGGLHRLTAETRDLFDRPVLAQELKGFGAVVFDPPRAGAEAQCRELAKSDVPVIAAVSCSPQSFARDAAILIEGGYTLDWIDVVDQFRWSHHVELTSRFSRG
ncbi:MAG: class I SAM-dependent RNA methyltransferase [Brevirhabdus sp.]